MGFVAPILGLVSAVSSISSMFKGNKQQSQSAPPPVQPLPAAPTTADASAKAQAEVDKRRRISLLSGGDTNLTKGAAAVGGADVSKNKLLGQ